MKKTLFKFGPRSIVAISAAILVIAGGLTFAFRNQIFAESWGSRMSTSLLTKLGFYTKPQPSEMDYRVVKAGTRTAYKNGHAQKVTTELRRYTGSYVPVSTKHVSTGVENGKLKYYTTVLNVKSNGTTEVTSTSSSSDPATGGASSGGSSTGGSVAQTKSLSQRVARRSVRRTASTHRAVYSSSEASAPAELTAEQRLQYYIGQYGGVNNYAAAAIFNLYNGGIQDTEAFNLAKSDPAKYGLNKEFTNNFNMLDKAMQFIKANGGGEKGFLTWARLQQDADKKGASIGEGSKEALDYLTAHPEYFGFQKAESEVIKNAGKSADGWLDYEAGVFPPESEASTTFNSTQNPPDLTQGEVPALDTPIILPDADSTESAISALAAAIPSKVKISGPTIPDFSEDVVWGAQIDAMDEFNASGDSAKAYDKFSFSLAKNIFPDSPTDEAALLKAMQANSEVGKVMLLIDPRDAKALIRNDSTKISGIRMAGAIADSIDILGSAGSIVQGEDSFGVYKLSKSVAENTIFANMQKLYGQGSVSLELSNVEVVQEVYNYGGQEAGDFTLAAVLAHGDPKKTDLLMRYVMDNPAYDVSKKVSIMQDALKAATSSKVYQVANIINKSSLTINPNTGTVNYLTAIKQWVPGTPTTLPHYNEVGYLAFDPVAQKYSGDISYEYHGKDVRFYSDPRTNDVYVAVSNADQKALASVGNMVQIMSVAVSPDGRLGGSFKLAGRLFNYNPSTQAFEIKIRDLLGQDSSLAKQLPNGLDVSIDTKGHVSGNYSLFGGEMTPVLDSSGKPTGQMQLASKSQGGLFFSSDGNLGFTYSIAASKQPDAAMLAGFSIDRHGAIGGAVNIGQVISKGTNVFLSFDKSGITGLNASLGSINLFGSKTTMGIGIDKTGGVNLSLAPILSSIPLLGGLPIPIGVNVGQDAHGNFRLSFPIGSMSLGGSESRDFAPPEIQLDESGNTRLECIYFYHSFKKLLKTVRTWNTDASNKCPLQIDQKEQVARSNKIFAVFNKSLGRNPTYNDFYKWYFYSGLDVLYPFEYGGSGSSDYRTSQLEVQMRSKLRSAPEYKTKTAMVNGKPIVTQLNLSNSIKLEDAVSQAKQTAQIVETGAPSADEIMPYNPFDPDQVAKYAQTVQAATAGTVSSTTSITATQTAAATTAPSAASTQTDQTVGNFLSAIESQGNSDPLFNNGQYTASTNDSSSVIVADTSATATTEASDYSTQTASESVTPTATVSVSAQTTVTAIAAEKEAQNQIETDQKLSENKITVAPGLNLVSVPRDDVSWSVVPFKSADLIVYEYDGGKWNLLSQGDLGSLVPGFAYYIYNPTNQNVDVVTILGETNRLKPLTQGWNLLANSTSLYAKLTDLLYKVPKPDQPTCAKADCMMTISLFDMFSKTVANSLAYKNLFLIKDSSATSAEDAFETIEVTPDNADNLVFAPGDTFWLYKWK